jgi:hypothetical protein
MISSSESKILLSMMDPSLLPLKDIKMRVLIRGGGRRRRSNFLTV